MRQSGAAVWAETGIIRKGARVAFAGLKAMLAGALRDRLAAVAVIAGAVVLVLTAWVLSVAAAVLYLSTHMGMVGALAASAGGLVVLALLLVWGIGARNRRSAELRASTRALWAATAVNAASAVMRGGERQAPTDGAEPGTGAGAGNTGKTLLVAGGIALMLLAFLFPSSTPKPSDDNAGPGPDGAA